MKSFWTNSLPLKALILSKSFTPPWQIWRPLTNEGRPSICFILVHYWYKRTQIYVYTERNQVHCGINQLLLISYFQKFTWSSTVVTADKLLRCHRFFILVAVTQTQVAYCGHVNTRRQHWKAVKISIREQHLRTKRCAKPTTIRSHPAGCLPVRLLHLNMTASPTYIRPSLLVSCSTAEIASWVPKLPRTL